MLLESNSKYQSLEKGMNISQIESYKSKYLKLALQQLLSCCDNIFTNGKKWGDEIEYSFLDQNLNPSLITASLISKLDDSKSYWMPEYGAWMLEGIPKYPYENILEVEKNMNHRRNYLSKLVNSSIRVETFSISPFLGLNLTNSQNLITDSKYIGDSYIYPSERFLNLTKNIKDRRGKKVDIILSSKNKFFNLDAMAFGMGCCSLQVTLQAKSRYHCCQLHDAFSLLGPILMSLSCSTPIIHGKLLDTDGRWNIISQSTDDRSQNVGKARFSNIPMFILPEGKNYNDQIVSKDDYIFNCLLNNGVPDQLAHLFAHILNHDPLVMFDSHFHESSNDLNCLNTYISTFWKSVRIKLPYNELSNETGWRVEFRVLDLQMTDFENAAFAVSSLLICKAMVWRNYFPYCKISQLDSDISLAIKPNSCLWGKFNWGDKKLSIKDIFDNNGSNSLLTICQQYLHYLNLSEIEFNLYMKYLNHVYRLSTGEVKTTATDIRDTINQKRAENNELDNFQIIKNSLLEIRDIRNLKFI